VLRKGTTSIEWKYTDGSWVSLVPISDLKGEDGKEVEIQKTSTHIQWRLQGGTWVNLIALSELIGAKGDSFKIDKSGLESELSDYDDEQVGFTFLATDTGLMYILQSDGWSDGVPFGKGEDGKNVELQVTATHIQWRLQGDSAWVNLIAISTLKGADGKDVEMRATATHFQWRLAGGTWNDLVAFADMPISTATASALAGKVSITGNVEITGEKNFIGTLLFNGEEVATMQDLSTVFKYKGSVASFANLPTSNRSTGDTWNTNDNGKNYAWSGTAWDDLGGTIDLSAYYTKAQIDALIANYYTKAQADTLLNAKQEKLVSGTNVKTINGQSILGPGNIEVAASGGGDSLAIINLDSNQSYTFTASSPSKIVIRIRPETTSAISNTPTLTFTNEPLKPTEFVIDFTRVLKAYEYKKSSIYTNTNGFAEHYSYLLDIVRPTVVAPTPDVLNKTTRFFGNIKFSITGSFFDLKGQSYSNSLNPTADINNCNSLVIKSDLFEFKYSGSGNLAKVRTDGINIAPYNNTTKLSANPSISGFSIDNYPITDLLPVQRGFSTLWTGAILQTMSGDNANEPYYRVQQGSGYVFAPVKDSFTVMYDPALSSRKGIITDISNTVFTS
jgi:hypothetical protein